jgi:hypothetical protein
MGWSQTSFKYYFQGDLHEAMSNHDLIATCADSFVTDTFAAFSLVRPVYRFASNCGVNFDDNATNALAIGDYTIEIYASLDTTLSYRKLIDYKNLNDDGGLYINDSSLDFYNILNTNNHLYLPGQYVFTTISRNNATQKVKLYVNGNIVDSVADTNGDALYNSYKLLRFFQNDTLNIFQEASAGKVAYIGIYNYVLDDQLIHNDYDSLGSILTATNVKNVPGEGTVKLWPNPATSTLQIESIADLNFSVTDLAGRQLLNGSVQKGTNKLQVGSLPAGMYFLHMQGANAGAVYKFIKQ